MLRLIAAVSVAVFLGGCASLPPASNDLGSAPIVERERELTRALVRGVRGGVQGFLAPGFRCELNVDGRITEPLGARGHLCTGMGHEGSQRSNRPEWQIEGEQAVPRVAELETIDVELQDGVATAVSIQRYRNWFPYDGATERRSRVTDTWVLNEGVWQLVHRLSEPLGQESSERSSR